MHAVSMRWVVSSIQCACSNIQGVHRVRVGNSGALALATLAPLSQDDLVRVRVAVRVRVRARVGARVRARVSSPSVP